MFLDSEIGTKLCAFSRTERWIVVNSVSGGTRISEPDISRDTCKRFIISSWLQAREFPFIIPKFVHCIPLIFPCTAAGILFKLARLLVLICSTVKPLQVRSALWLPSSNANRWCSRKQVKSYAHWQVKIVSLDFSEKYSYNIIML